MEKKDSRFLEEDRLTRIGRLQRFFAHYAMGGPSVEPLPEGVDVAALRRKAERCRSRPSRCIS
jgi:hypothetical protein